MAGCRDSKQRGIALQMSLRNKMDPIDKGGSRSFFIDDNLDVVHEGRPRQQTGYSKGGGDRRESIGGWVTFALLGSDPWIPSWSWVGTSEAVGCGRIDASHVTDRGTDQVHEMKGQSVSHVEERRRGSKLSKKRLQICHMTSSRLWTTRLRGTFLVTPSLFSHSHTLLLGQPCTEQRSKGAFLVRNSMTGPRSSRWIQHRSAFTFGLQSTFCIR